ncbi:hypothetical protein A2955_03005 [Candidatus Woesebacteria bacterium RIFCSPLOWO2_01_FULL_37_19]|uniref:Uncharacterized protein n=2 Tax=Candidatus Woeseibacteriota TaxID=1752722 RepID=A0A1F8BBX4_9BACT|nr:MAG: hypothetical protein A2771_00160 [Candidatus Woesebacteria bacterium RIFCSPHIGHO2_01_FULL_38_26b]OGM61430.1 MAG: hypothetical protein A2955_03005 [Candidatus Woesebacteria bacterium RIFCSPLOWO2_01_FULL_37_19]
MLDQERLRRAFPKVVRKQQETESEIESRINEFYTTYKVEEIRSHTGIALKHYGVYDDERGHLIFIGHSSPSMRVGLGLTEEVTEKINRLKPNFWVVANVNYAHGLKGRLTKIMTSPLDLPLHLQVAVDNTVDLRKLTLPRSLNKHQMEEMSKRLPLLCVLEDATRTMSPVTDVAMFPWDYFKLKDTSSFLLPELDPR